MNPAFAAYTVRQLRALSIVDADRALCAMHDEALHALAQVLGIRLPTLGGDKPALIGAALLPSARAMKPGELGDHR